MRSIITVAGLISALFAASAQSETSMHSSTTSPQAILRSPFEAINAGEFAAACNNDQGICADMIGEVLLNMVLYSPARDICLPGVNYPDKIPTWLLAHPETSQMTAENGIALAITTLYRCGPRNNY